MLKNGILSASVKGLTVGDSAVAFPAGRVAVNMAVVKRVIVGPVVVVLGAEGWLELHTPHQGNPDIPAPSLGPFSPDSLVDGSGHHLMGYKKFLGGALSKRLTSICSCSFPSSFCLEMLQPSCDHEDINRELVGLILNGCHHSRVSCETKKSLGG